MSPGAQHTVGTQGRDGGRQKQLTSLAPSSALRAPSPANGRRAAAHLAAPCDSPSPAQRETGARSAGGGRERSEQAVALDYRFHRTDLANQYGRASCRGRECAYVSVAVVADRLKKTHKLV